MHIDTWLPNGNFSSLTLPFTFLATMHGFTLDGNEDDSAERKFSKVYGSLLGWSSGELAVGGLQGIASPANCSQVFYQ
jgi:hypothetical protein